LSKYTQGFLKQGVPNDSGVLENGENLSFEISDSKAHIFIQ